MNSITIIDQDNQFSFQDLSGLVGFEYPTIINAIGDISGKGGAVYLASKFGRRRLSWQGLLKTDVMENRRLLERSLRVGRLKTIRFETCDGLALETEVEIDRLTMPYKLGRTKYLIEATAPDWRFFKQVAFELTTTETVVGGGADIPAAIPMDIYNEGIAEKFIINNGTEYSEPTFTITGPGTRFIVENKTTGESFMITRTLTEDDTVTVNTETSEVLLNGTIPIYGSLSGSFWKVSPGQSQIGFTAIGPGHEAVLSISFQEAYLGI